MLASYTTGYLNEGQQISCNMGRAISAILRASLVFVIRKTNLNIFVQDLVSIFVHKKFILPMNLRVS